MSVFVGDTEGGVLAFDTYTYTNLNGAGNPNLFKTVKYGDGLTKWHFIYFGYTRKQKRAAGFVQFEGKREEVDFPSTNHFLNRNYFVYIAKDKFYPSYNGQIASFKLILCDGAFDPQFPTDPVPPKTPVPPPKPPVEPTCVEGSA